MKFKVAVVQFDTKQYNPEKNLLKMANFVKQANKEGADVIVFPEDFITGPLINRPDLIDSNNYYKNQFQKLAEENSIDIVAGSIIEQDKKGIFNVSYYIDKAGSVKARYCKVNLWLSERSRLSAGNEIRCFNTKFGKAAIIICWDLAFPEIFRKLKRQNVKIVYCPAWWSYQDAGVGLKHNAKTEELLLNVMCPTRAMENGIILIYCNAAGRLQVGRIDEELVGHSQIAVPFNGTISILKGNKEGIMVQTLDTSIIKDHETAYRIREDLLNRTLN